jgi:hypothetical protein
VEMQVLDISGCANNAIVIPVIKNRIFELDKTRRDNFMINIEQFTSK